MMGEAAVEIEAHKLRAHLSSLTLQLEEIGSFGVDVRPLGLEHLVEALALKTASGHCEVDKGHSGAEIGRKLHLRKEEE